MTPTTTGGAPQSGSANRRRGLRWIVGVPLAVLALAGVGVWRAHSIADATIERHLASFHAALATLQATPHGRAALEAPEEPGAAEDLVEALRAAVAAIPYAEWLVVQEFDLDAHPSATRHPVLERAMIVRIQPALDSLDRIWNRRSAGLSPLDLDGLISPTSEVERGEAVQRTLSAAIRLARAAGGEESAIRLATDEALVGQDLVRCGTWVLTLVSSVLERRATGVLADILADSTLTKESLDRLARRLVALRGARPSLDSAWRTQRMILQGQLADDAQASVFLGALLTDEDSLRTWRTLYSTRIARSHALRTLESLPESLPEELLCEPLAESADRVLAASRISQEDPIFRHFLGPWSLVVGRLRARDVHAAVLELAVALARFEAEHAAWPTSEADLVPKYLAAIPTSPLDLRGLRFAANKAWSRGPDGDDDGGRPLSDADDLSADGDGDIVIEVKGHR